MKEPDITHLCFQEFFWVYLIDCEVNLAELNKNELIWDNFNKMMFLKEALDECLETNLQRLLFT
jgi:hypothetical protein